MSSIFKSAVLFFFMNLCRNLSFTFGKTKQVDAAEIMFLTATIAAIIVCGLGQMQRDALHKLRQEVDGEQRQDLFDYYEGLVASVSTPGIYGGLISQLAYMAGTSVVKEKVEDFTFYQSLTFSTLIIFCYLYFIDDLLMKKSILLYKNKKNAKKK